jgi:hypothetical protein
MNRDDKHEQARQLLGAATSQLEQLKLPVGLRASGMARVAEMRRRRLSDTGDPREAGYLSLVEDADGLLDWRVDGGPARTPARRATRRGLFDVTPIDQVAFEPVQGSQVSAYLKTLDEGFNPRYGLFDLAGQRVNEVQREGRILLFVHGTFSQSEALIDPLDEQPAGRLWLQAAQARYDQVMVFEHPTLAVGPWLNALDLARAFGDTAAQIDVVCHSRGGLVVRWWLEVLSRALLPRSRVVFFGAPLMGTGLASPYRLRTALKLVTNLAQALQQSAGLASLAVPLFTVAQGLMTLLASASGVLARSPVADATVALVPGLAAMARYGMDGQQFILGNAELEKLGWGLAAAPPNYFAVSSNFEPEDLGWQFWRFFRNPKERLADGVAGALFSGENDLVVDTDSMTRLSLAARITDPARRLDFGSNPTVHHLNYFSQPRSLQFISQALAF